MIDQRSSKGNAQRFVGRRRLKDSWDSRSFLYGGGGRGAKGFVVEWWDLGCSVMCDLSSCSSCTTFQSSLKQPRRVRNPILLGKLYVKSLRKKTLLSVQSRNVLGENISVQHNITVCLSVREREKKRSPLSQLELNSLIHTHEYTTRSGHYCFQTINLCQ